MTKLVGVMVMTTVAGPTLAQSTPPVAVDADRGVDALPDVTVTARRRSEEAQRVPGSLSVVGGNLLDQS